MTSSSTGTIRPVLLDKIRTSERRLLADGALLSDDQMQRAYEAFRARFGPDVLAGLDGLALLERMHARGPAANKSSMMYWLEFKNDEEFPEGMFGGIGGGSALKFGIYQQPETGKWFTGSSRAVREISVEEAIEAARQQRNQVVAASRILLDAGEDASAVDFVELGRRVMDAAPGVADLAWGHKYLGLIAPPLVDLFHVQWWQQYQLIRLLQVPPQGDRYVIGGALARIAQEVDIPLGRFCRLLVYVSGSVRRYWRVGTGPADRPGAEWPRMRDGGYVAVGWEVGDLSDIAATREGKEELRSRIEHLYESKAALGQGTQQLFNFLTAMKEGDVVVAARGNTVLGIGELAGDYCFEPRAAFVHQRPVHWLDTSEWPLPDPEAKLTTVREMGKPLNLVAIEERLLAPSTPPPSPDDDGDGDAVVLPLEPLTGVLARVERALRRKGQVILYGPPGTGKTYHGQRAVQELAARSHYGRPWHALRPDEESALTFGDRIAIEACTFHPGFGYEDFIEGYRPAVNNGALTYELTDGVFKRLCQRAKANPDVDHFLLIDEINRGDIPRILGELITLLEADKRDRQVTLPLSREPFSVPKNVFIVGTMNTADRSIALLDTALRRRFAFVELMPDPSVLANAVVQGLPLGPWLTALNTRIRQYVTRDARNLQIGHSYLMHQGKPISDVDRLVQAVHDDIIPLIEEYCYEDYAALRSILGDTIVKVDEQRIDAELFEPSRRPELLAALLQVDPDLTATEQAVIGEADAMVDEEGEDEDASDPTVVAADAIPALPE